MTDQPRSGWVGDLSNACVHGARSDFRGALWPFGLRIQNRLEGVEESGVRPALRSPMNQKPLSSTVRAAFSPTARSGGPGGSRSPSLCEVLLDWRNVLYYENFMAVRTKGDAASSPQKVASPDS